MFVFLINIVSWFVFVEMRNEMGNKLLYRDLFYWGRKIEKVNLNL